MSFICHIHNYTEYNDEWNVFSAFNPSKWSSGQPTLRRLGSSRGFGALLKGLTSVVDTSCQSHDSNPQPWVTLGFKSNDLSIRPRLPLLIEYANAANVFLHWMCWFWPHCQLQSCPHLIYKTHVIHNYLLRSLHSLKATFLTSLGE